MTEDQLQQKCFLYFHNKYKNLRGRLFRTENKTTVNAKGLGLVKGVSDLQYVLPNGKIVPVELKVNGSRHKVKHLEEQLEWVSDIAKCSGLGFFCFSFDHFKQVIDSLVRFDMCETWLHIESISTIEAIRNIISDAQIKGNLTTYVNYNISNYDPKENQIKT